MDLQVCQGSQHAYALYDSTFQMVHPAQRNCLQQVDLAAQAVLRTAQEFSEEYELVCFAPGDGADWGNELVAGAVHGSARAKLPCPAPMPCPAPSALPCPALPGPARPCPALLVQLHGQRRPRMQTVCWLASKSAAGLACEGWGGCACPGFCTACYRSGLPSLCFHKSTAATAAFCIFDLRSSMHMASY